MNTQQQPLSENTSSYKAPLYARTSVENIDMNTHEAPRTFMKKRLLLIDDDTHLQTWLEKAIPDNLFILDIAESGRQGLDLISEHKPDLILLDWKLPGWSGFEICQYLKQHKEYAHIPVIMVSGNTNVQFKVSALNAGVDDYVTKPFEMEELIARIKSVMRRQGTPPPDILRISGITINTTAYSAMAGDKPLKLTSMEFNLLHMLMKNAGRLLTRKFLLERIWGYDGDMATRTTDVYIRRLRFKLGSAYSGCIKSERGLGYKFKGNVSLPPSSSGRTAMKQKSELKHMGSISNLFKHIS